MFKYTICFIRQGDRISLLNREKPGWMGSWNGVGGRLEEGETPTECVIREVFEETGIELKEVEFKGIVKWTEDGKPTGGMYAFTAEIQKNFLYKTPRKFDEGILDWKEIDWIFHPKNTGIADNLPQFLPKMLEEKGLYEYICYFRNNVLEEVESNPLEYENILTTEKA